MIWGGRWEGGSGLGTHVHPWLIHVNVWQNQYSIVKQNKVKIKIEKKISTNLTLYEAYTNHWTNLKREEIKRKNKFNLEAWKKETSNTIS